MKNNKLRKTSFANKNVIHPTKDGITSPCPAPLKFTAQESFSFLDRARISRARDWKSVQLEQETNSLYSAWPGCEGTSILLVAGSKPLTLPKTNELALKMDGWNTIVSFWDGLFSGAMLVLGNVYWGWSSHL